MKNKNKIKKPIISIFLIIIVCSLCLCLCSCYTKTDTPNDENDNNQIVLKGSGSVEDPIQLCNAEELYFFAKTVNEDKLTYQNKNIALMSNIDLKGNEWSPIGVEKDYWSKDIRPFLGNFNGNGFTISNFKITQSVRYAGFFGYCKENTISDLNLENIVINIKTSKQIITAGILVGFINSTDILNCNVSGQMAVENTSAAQYIGGLVGEAMRTSMMEHSNINNCTSKITIKSINCSIPNIGGLIGRSSSYDVLSCKCDSIINYTFSPVGDVYIGGMIGGGSHNSIESCDINTEMDIKAGFQSYQDFFYIAGIVADGYLVTLKDCHIDGTIKFTLLSENSSFYKNIQEFSCGNYRKENCISNLVIIA